MASPNAYPDRSYPAAPTPPRRTPLLKIVLAVVVVLILLAIIVPFFLNANAFKPEIESRLSAALNRRVTLGSISLSLWSGNLVANNISIADDPAFSSAPFLTAQSLHVGVEMGPLLFHKQLNITRLTLDSPAIQLIHAENGKWNFSSLGSNAQSSSSSQPSNPPDLSVGELKIENGSATVSTQGAGSKPVHYSAIDLAAQQMSFNRNFPFQLSAKLPANGSLHLDGNAGPLARQDASTTPFHATLKVAGFDPVAVGVIESDKGISMSVDINSQIASDGSTLTSSGKIQATHLQLARTGSPAPNPVDIDYAVSQNLAARTGQVSDLALHTGNVAAHVTGSYRMTNQAIDLNLHLAAPSLPVDQVEQLLPAVGVHLPSGSSLHGGTINANLAITGPATATTIAGPVEIDNTTLAGFNLGSKIEGINPFGGSSNATQIQKVATTVNSSPQTTQFSNIDAIVPAVGTATGSGSVSPAGALDFHLTAKLSATSGVGAMATQATKQVGGLIGGLLQGAVSTAQKSGIPLSITGTASNPSIRADLGGMFKH